MKNIKDYTYKKEKIGNVCFIAHFHQPYWQPKKIWKQINLNSYVPWLNLLSEMIKDERFSFNIHFSGPFLIQMSQNNEIYINAMKYIIKNPKINLIAGFIDEAFVQLSSRPDDVFYQLKAYIDFSNKVLGLQAEKFFGIHIVEREISERLIQKITYASKHLGFVPLIYLDAETFYESYSVYPGDSKDLYFKYFNTKDPVHITSIPFIPKEGLYFLFRDEIEGIPFYSIPLHSIYRYHLLKRKSRNPYDVRLSPEDYLNMILQEKRKILKFSQKLGAKTEPIILIFTDAERLGQWSGDAKGDLIWLKKLFHLIMNNRYLKLSTLKSYFYEQGFLDTYPLKTSNSYPEFKNWSANRGIRGIVFADPKLRKVYSQSLQLEQFQEYIEQFFVKKFLNKISIPLKLKDIENILFFNVLNSPRRFILIEKIAKNFENPVIFKLYRAMNRLRNISYIEDGKWATRHPCFGNQPHLDSMSLTYLDIAEYLGIRIIERLNGVFNPELFKYVDWNKDGYKEVILQNLHQKLIISTKGGHIIFHQIRANKLINSSDEEILTLLESITNNAQIDGNIENLSTNICNTEPDSELHMSYVKYGTRIEKCRNSCRIDILIKKDGKLKYLGNFSEELFNIKNQSNSNQLKVALKCKKEFLHNENYIQFELIKNFKIINSQLKIELELNLINGHNINENFIVVPEFVFTLLPSDGLDFTPNLFIDFLKSNGYNSKTLYEIETSCFELNDSRLKFIKFKSQKKRANPCKLISILPTIVQNQLKVRKPKISIQLGENCVKNLEKVEILPAIKNFYKNAFFNGNSNLNYHTSGIKICPYLNLSKKLNQKFNFIINYDLDEDSKNNHYLNQPINLINIKRKESNKK